MRHHDSATGICRRRITWRRGRIARAFDGTTTIQQPLIEPLYGGKSAHEILSYLAGQAGPEFA